MPRRSNPPTRAGVRESQPTASHSRIEKLYADADQLAGTVGPQEVPRTRSTGKVPIQLQQADHAGGELNQQVAIAVGMNASGQFVAR